MEIMPRASEFHYCYYDSSEANVINSVTSRVNRVGLLQLFYAKQWCKPILSPVQLISKAELNCKSGIRY